MSCLCPLVGRERSYNSSICIDLENIPDFFLCRGCVYKHKSSITNYNNLWITQRVAPCGNRMHYTLRGSRLTSRRANRAVIVMNILLYLFNI
uniref:SFRICE_015779 n=1 Tax=Spodoptera frugiperda TaxID=7108 RepID=A0A2H1WI25_SPOFR